MGRSLLRLVPLGFMMACCFSAHATSILVSGNASFTWTASATYAFSTLGNSSNVDASATGFATAYGSSDGLASIMVNSVTQTIPVSYGGSLMGGSTLNSASLELSTIATMNGSVSGVLQPGGETGSRTPFAPSFSSTPSTLFISISSAIHGTYSFTLPGTTGTTVDLIAAGYSADLLAGNPINISWFEQDQLNQTAPYDGNAKGQHETWSVSQTGSPEAGYSLNIDYTAPVPEPVSMMLVGAGLMAIGKAAASSRKKR